MKTHRHAGFSLFELQMVVVMLAVLAALLLPLLAGFRRASQQAGCFNNLKQLGVADLVYVADHGVFIQPGASQYLGNNSEWIGCMVENSSMNTNVLLCPTASQPAPATIISQYGLGFSGNTVGTADYYFIRGGLVAGNSGLTQISASYMANGWLYCINNRGQGDASSVEGNYGIIDPAWVYTNEASMQQPATTPMFFDGTWLDCWPAERDSPAKNLYTGILGEGSSGHAGVEMGRVTMTRHGINPEAADRNHTASWKISPSSAGAIDMVSGDGHVQTVKMNIGIYDLTWHRNWGRNVPVNPGIPQ
jgi:hypothetical protein